MDRRRFEAEYPFPSSFLTIGNYQYHYVDVGEGPTVLLVHGNPTWSFYYRHLIQALRHRFRVVAVDHIGCGLSDKPADYSYRLGRHADNLHRLATTLGLTGITLVMHDWGGAIGIRAFADDPKRVARLVLMNTAAFRDTRIPWPIALCRIPGFGEVAVRGLNGFCRAALWTATTQRASWTLAARAGYLAPYSNWSNRIAIHRFVRDIPLSSDHPSYGDLVRAEEALPSLSDRPTLLIWGMRDWCFTSAFLDRWQQYFPGAAVERMANAGHYVLEDARDECIKAIERHCAGAG